VVRLHTAQTRLTLQVGASAKLVAYGIRASGRRAKATWTSRSVWTATVTAGGQVRARRAGSAILVARAGGLSVAVRVTVVRVGSGRWAR
jgi:hypothetical protein